MNHNLELSFYCLNISYIEILIMRHNNKLLLSVQATKEDERFW